MVNSKPNAKTPLFLRRAAFNAGAKVVVASISACPRQYTARA
jgi:hypothetical protein